MPPLIFLKKCEGVDLVSERRRCILFHIRAGKESAMDWNAIKSEYIAGGISYRKLAEKYGIPFGTFKRVALKEGWYDLREQAKQKAATKIVEIESDKQANRMKRLLTVSDELLVVVENAVRNISLGELVVDKSVLKSLSGTIKDIKEIQNIKTQLDIEEQKARIAILKKQAEAENDGSTNVAVVFGTNEEETKWAE